MEYWKKLRAALGNQQLIMNTAAGAIIRDNKILLMRSHENGNWYIPGGYQELNESIEDTIVRELQEEFGIELKIDKLIGIYSSPRWISELKNGHKQQQVLFFFSMKGDFDVNKVVLQEEEVYEYSFFDLDILPENIMPCCKEKISDLKNFQGQALLK